MSDARLSLSIVNYFNRNWERVRGTLYADLLTFARDVNRRIDRASVAPATTVAALDGTSVVGTSTRYARADHTHGFALLTADPGAPVDDTWWIVREGSSPEQAFLRIRVGGVTYQLAAMDLV